MPLGVALLGVAPLLGVTKRRPAAAVPQHHRAAAVLTLRNGPFERAVFQRVVLDADGEALLAGHQARPLGDRPALQHAVHLQAQVVVRSEEHTSELQSLMRISYAVFCLKKKKQYEKTDTTAIKEGRYHTTYGSQ